MKYFRIELNYKNNYRKCFIFIIVEYFNELRVINYLIFRCEDLNIKSL